MIFSRILDAVSRLLSRLARKFLLEVLFLLERKFCQTKGNECDAFVSFASFLSLFFYRYLEATGRASFTNFALLVLKSFHLSILYHRRCRRDISTPFSSQASLVFNRTFHSCLRFLETLLFLVFISACIIYILFQVLNASLSRFLRFVCWMFATDKRESLFQRPCVLPFRYKLYRENFSSFHALFMACLFSNWTWVLWRRGELILLHLAFHWRRRWSCVWNTSSFPVYFPVSFTSHIVDASLGIIIKILDLSPSLSHHHLRAVRLWFLSRNDDDDDHQQRHLTIHSHCSLVLTQFPSPDPLFFLTLASRICLFEQSLSWEPEQGQWVFLHLLHHQKKGMQADSLLRKLRWKNDDFEHHHSFETRDGFLHFASQTLLFLQ